VSGETVNDGRNFVVSCELGMRPFFYAIAVLKENTNAAVLFSDYAESLARLLVAGWREKAELFARHGLAQLQMHDVQRGKFKVWKTPREAPAGLEDEIAGYAPN
jgi:hypothetical protein